MSKEEEKNAKRVLMEASMLAGQLAHAGSGGPAVTAVNEGMKIFRTAVAEASMLAGKLEAMQKDSGALQEVARAALDSSRVLLDGLFQVALVSSVGFGKAEGVRIDDNGAVWVRLRLVAGSEAAGILFDVEDGKAGAQLTSAASLAALSLAVGVIREAAAGLQLPEDDADAVAERAEKAKDALLAGYSGKASESLGAVQRFASVTAEDVSAHMSDLLPPDVGVHRALFSGLHARGKDVFEFRAQWLEHALRPRIPGFDTLGRYEMGRAVMGTVRHALSSEKQGGATVEVTEEDRARYRWLPENAGLLLPRYHMQTQRGQVELALWDEHTGDDSLAAAASGGLGGYAGKLSLPMLTVAERAGGAMVSTSYGELAKVCGINLKGRRLREAMEKALYALDVAQFKIQAPSGASATGGILDVLTVTDGSTAGATGVVFRRGILLEALHQSQDDRLKGAVGAKPLVDFEGWAALDAKARGDRARRLYLWLVSEWNRQRLHRSMHDAPCAYRTLEDFGRAAGIQGAGGDGKERRLTNLHNAVKASFGVLEGAGLVIIEQPKSRKADAKWGLKMPKEMNDAYCALRTGGRNLLDAGG